MDPDARRLLWEIFADEDARYENCTHPKESVKFNGGNPWVVCYDCGAKLRDATDEDLDKAMKRGSE